MLPPGPRSKGAGANLDPQHIPGAQRSDAIPALPLGAAAGVQQHRIPGAWQGDLWSALHPAARPLPHTAPGAALAPLSPLFPGPLLGLIS